MTDSNIVLFSGYARLPQGISSSYIHSTMVLVVLIDVRSGEIVDAECTLSTRASEQFINKMLVGRKIVEDAEDLYRMLERCYEGHSKKAIITALRAINTSYRSHIKASGKCDGFD